MLDAAPTHANEWDFDLVVGISSIIKYMCPQMHSFDLL